MREIGVKRSTNTVTSLHDEKELMPPRLSSTLPQEVQCSGMEWEPSHDEDAGTGGDGQR